MISILMSIYNETAKQICEAVESLLSQTYQNFELIVINDNPNRNDVKEILASYKDTRIRLYQNETNLGLAMSMNKAAELSSSEVEFFARMDADDIAEPNRLEKSYTVLSSWQYDLVFSDYSYIDEKSNEIHNRDPHTIYTSEELTMALGIKNVIHHPTVMFTRSIFEKVGGYRDFPCSQDADLWFRMYEAGCRFKMLPDKLLKYRINSNSVSNKKWYQQQLTCSYIYDLSIERLKNHGEDSFSSESYHEYLRKWGVCDKKKEAELRYAYHCLEKANVLGREGHKLQSFVLRLWVFIISSFMRRHILNVKRKRLLLRQKGISINK